MPAFTSPNFFKESQWMFLEEKVNKYVISYVLTIELSFQKPNKLGCKLKYISSCQDIMAWNWGV